jgi:transposase-like protein
MHGLASGDFQQCFHALLGSEAPLSESSILQQKQQLESEYQAWKKRPLEREYLYVWADGVADLWKALRDVFPTARRQRCWVHKMRNVLDKVPLTVHDEVLQALREIYHASDEKTARSLVQAFATRYRHRYPKAVACLEESLNVLFSYFYFPRKHWKSIKSTNVIESLFSAVKLRTDAARRIPKRESALYLVFKLLLNQQQRLRKIHGYRLVQRTIELAQQTKSPKLRIAA